MSDFLHFEVSTQQSPPPDKEEKIFLDYFKEIWDEARHAKEPVKRMMDASYLAYRSILTDFAYSNRNIGKWGLSIYVPYTFQTIAGLEAQLAGKPPQYSLSPVRSPKDRGEAAFISKLSQAEFKRAQAMRVLADATQTSLIFGTSFLNSFLRYDRRKKKFIKDVDENTGQPTYKEDFKTFYKGWSIREHHPLKVYLPKTHEHDHKKWGYYIYRDLVDVRDLYAYYEAHPELQYKKNYKFLKPGGNLNDDLDVYYKQDILYRLPVSRYPGSPKDLMNSVFPATHTEQMQANPHLIEAFWIYSDDIDTWAVVAGDRVIEMHANPLEGTKELPIVPMRDYEIKNYPWGVGEPELIRWLQFEANALHNLTLDSVKYSTSPVFAMMSAYLQDEDDFEIVPGKIVRLKNIPNLTVDNAIKAINMPEVKGSIFKMLEVNETIVRQTTGAGQNIIGGDQADQGGSATDSNNLRQASSTRVYDRARRIEQNTLVDVIHQQIEFMSEFYDEEMTVKVSNDEWYKLLPGDKKDYTETELTYLDQSSTEEGFAGHIFSSDIAKGYVATVDGESTLPITKNDKQTQGMSLLKIASETRRPFTEEELGKNPQLPQLFPQGAPVLDAAKVAEKILLPTFSVVDNPEEFLWKADESTGPDRVRNPGRPPDAFVPPSSPEEAADTQMRMEAQPANSFINANERM